MSNIVSLIIWAIIWFILGGVVTLVGIYKVSMKVIAKNDISDNFLRDIGEDAIDEVLHRKH